MSWVAADDSGTEIAGFGYGTRVTWTQTDGTVKTGKIIVPSTDRIGDVHRIVDDADPTGELVKLSPQFVNRI
jgi:hypothetical protein